MSELFYRDDRDADFMRACEKVRKESGKHLSVREVVERALSIPAGSFYIHPREYANIIRRGRNNLPKGKASRALHTEILNRYDKLKSRHPHFKEEDINKMLAEQSAPRFYLSLSRGICLYYELIKK